MKLTFRQIKTKAFLFLFLTGCLDPYQPKVIQQDISALVVDGFVDTTHGTINVDLSRTLPLLSESTYQPETNATIILEGEDGSQIILNNVGGGKYSLTELSLNDALMYRLYISSETDEYRSEYVTLKSSPSLDGVIWEVPPEADGVQIYVNAHDPTNKTRYYQWVFSETWEYQTELISIELLDDDSIRIRNDDELIHRCWKTQQSNKVLIEQTTRLSNDVVHKFPIHFIPKESQRISRNYSILVQQRALDEATYNYLLQLQKTTEVMGGLFDPMPSQLIGNLHNINKPSEPVIGYFRGGAVQEKRIFITREDLSSSLPPYLSFACTTDTAPSIEALENMYPNIQLLYTMGPGGLITAPISCMDCRVSGGGVLTKPTFWP